MSILKKQILESLNHFNEDDCSVTTPDTNYSLIAWDGDEVKAVPLQKVTDISYTNAGTAGTGVVATEYGDAYSHVTVLTISGLSQAIAGANLGFGKKIYDFPLGAIKCKRALINITLQAGTDTTVGEIGLGSVVATGSITGLGGTATFENIVDGFANTAPSLTGAATQAQKECEADNPDGTSTAVDLYLNFAGGWSATEFLYISGTITIFWDFLGTY